MNASPLPSSASNNINTEAFNKYKFDESIFSRNEQEIFVFLSVCTKCRRKLTELQVDKFDMERFKKKETKFPHEMKTIFESLCAAKQLSMAPAAPCLSAWKDIDISSKYYYSNERNALFKDMLNCASLDYDQDMNRFINFKDDQAYEDYMKMQEFGNQLAQRGSVKKVSVIYNNLMHPVMDDNGELIQGDNSPSTHGNDSLSPNDIMKMKKIIRKLKLEKHTDHVLDDFEDLKTLPPHFQAYSYAISSAFCSNHVIQCLRKRLPLQPEKYQA
ncbi:hypothetical protein C9374_011660 [Naegleria lovaniensis]|uniref:Uncharacterized protein n=1 Tax=Naegleria lovaniensis TaxID=51637 RepID=A0AA88G9N8_NAELO|nr:uncharacterized protein C9374_011660 [Naegleria lovaniensis]KAG2373995.1 hypothetical protein C9374_011660 [Naegleria lovaniensis]